MSRTQTHVIVKERPHDYLYDTVFKVSSDRDHARANFRAQASGERLRKHPIYPTMFSDLRHCPRTEVRLDPHDPVPKFISRQWRGYADQAREALVNYVKMTHDASIHIPPRVYEVSDPVGRDRAMFFRRPIIPYGTFAPVDVVLATNAQDALYTVQQQQQGDGARPFSPGVRHAATQTDYRESEVQTEPYTPEYLVRPGQMPELLTLATLAHGRGLPAGLHEVEMIERARARRAWEATLPPLNDVTQLGKRRKMMDEMERQEWAHREKEIEELQEARLEILVKLLRQREESHQEINAKKLDRLWSKKQKEKEDLFKKIRYEHIKAIRKLTKRRRNVEGNLVRRDMIQEYSDPGSQAFAPLTRIGVFLDKGSEQYVVKSKFLTSFDGLTSLESTLPSFVLQPRCKVPKPEKYTKAGFLKGKYREENELTQLYEYIKGLKPSAAEPKKPLRFLEKIEKPIPRPPTPTVSAPPEELEAVELAVIFLQQLLRGRAIQAMMFEGMEKRKELIKELRSTHALQDEEMAVKRQERQAAFTLQRQRRLFEHKELVIDEAMSELEGSSLADMHDFLSKELQRLQEERRIHAFVMMAERQRRIREAEESGLRQVEERRRREEDEIFKQVVKVHQATVDTYLEDIVLGSVEHASDELARREVHQLADMINDVAHEAEARRTSLESEEIVAEMVHQFLIPEVHKQTMRERINTNQRKYLLAAHREIFGQEGPILHGQSDEPPPPADSPPGEDGQLS